MHIIYYKEPFAATGIKFFPHRNS